MSGTTKISWADWFNGRRVLDGRTHDGRGEA
jgi:hypothetical protein